MPPLNCHIRQTLHLLPAKQTVRNHLTEVSPVRMPPEPASGQADHRRAVRHSVPVSHMAVPAAPDDLQVPARSQLSAASAVFIPASASGLRCPRPPPDHHRTTTGHHLTMTPRLSGGWPATASATGYVAGPKPIHVPIASSAVGFFLLLLTLSTLLSLNFRVLSCPNSNERCLFCCIA